MYRRIVSCALMRKSTQYPFSYTAICCQIAPLGHLFQGFSTVKAKFFIWKSVNFANGKQHIRLKEFYKGRAG